MHRGLQQLASAPGPVVEMGSTTWIHGIEVCGRCENTEVSQSIQTHKGLQNPQDGGETRNMRLIEHPEYCLPTDKMLMSQEFYFIFLWFHLRYQLLSQQWPMKDATLGTRWIVLNHRQTRLEAPFVFRKCFNLAHNLWKKNLQAIFLASEKSRFLGHLATESFTKHRAQLSHSLQCTITISNRMLAWPC